MHTLQIYARASTMIHFWKMRQCARMKRDIKIPIAVLTQWAIFRNGIFISSRSASYNQTSFLRSEKYSLVRTSERLMPISKTYLGKKKDPTRAIARERAKKRITSASSRTPTARVYYNMGAQNAAATRSNLTYDRRRHLKELFCKSSPRARLVYTRTRGVSVRKRKLGESWGRVMRHSRVHPHVCVCIYICATSSRTMRI